LIGGGYIFYKNSTNISNNIPTPIQNAVQPASSTVAPSSSSSISIAAGTSTAGWQTYTNTQYGFSFMYPADIFTTVDTNTTLVTSTESSADAANVFTGKTVNQGQLAIAIFINQKFDSSKLSNVSTTKMGDRIAYESFDYLELGCSAYHARTGLGDRTMLVQLSQCQNGQYDQQYIYPSADLMNQILSTFKFFTLTPTINQS